MIINLPPRHLKSHLASICFPAWCLGHDPNAQILCPSYVQDLADKLSRDCRRILANDWYRQVFAELRIRRLAFLINAEVAQWQSVSKLYSGSSGSTIHR